MSHPGDSASFVPRENLKRTLTYRRHIKWSYWSNLFAASVFWLIFLSLILNSTSDNQILFAAIATAVYAVAIWKVRHALRSIAYASIAVFNDNLTIESLGEKKIFPFQEIKEIKFNYVPYLSGWFQVISDKGEYKFPISLERSEYVLEAIVAFNPSLASKEEIEKYRKTAVLTDHGWAYFHDKVPSIFKMILKFVLTPMIAAVPLAIISGHGHGDSFDTIKLIVMSVFFAVIQILMSGLAMKLESIVLIAKAAPEITKNPNHLKRNIEFENKVHRTSELIQKILLAILVLVYCIRLLK
jgi:hypothetical protein